MPLPWCPPFLYTPVMASALLVALDKLSAALWAQQCSMTMEASAFEQTSVAEEVQRRMVIALVADAVGAALRPVHHTLCPRPLLTLWPVQM